MTTRIISRGVTIVNRKNLYHFPSPGGRELEGGGIHPHLNPLPSRERKFTRNCVEHHNASGCIDQVSRLHDERRGFQGEFFPLDYLRSELETYSNQTLELYSKDVSDAIEEGRNLVKEHYTFLFQTLEYGSIYDLPKKRTS